MIDQNYDKFTQTVFTVQQSDADYFASHLPWRSKGVWLSDCCLITIDAMRVARITLMPSPAKASTASSNEFIGKEFPGMLVEVIHKFRGRILSQEFPFSSYIETAKGASQVPRLFRAKDNGREKFGWYNGKQRLAAAPRLEHYCQAIEVFLQVMGESAPSSEELSKHQHHETQYAAEEDDDGSPIIVEGADG